MKAPMSQEQVTGERMLIDAYRQSVGGNVIYGMHMASYRFALPYCRQKNVLDLGSGTGYGSALLAGHAKEVAAVDISEEAVDFARKNYNLPNLSFEKIVPDCPLPYPDDSFDVVISFQVLEHVKDDVFYMSEAARVLRADGVLILATPDRKHRLFPGQKPWNRWHLREYSDKALMCLAQDSFNVEPMRYMGGGKTATQIELRRYALLKIITLPFTLPIMPEKWRQFGLNSLHKLKDSKKRQTHRDSVVETLEEHEFFFESKVDVSLNLLIIARPKKRVK